MPEALVEKSLVIIFNSDGMGHADTPELPQILAPEVPWAD